MFLLQDIAVYHLRQPNSAFIADHVEGLRFDIRRVHAYPRQIIFLELGIRCLLRLLCHGLDRRRAVYGFLDAHPTLT